MNLREFTDPPKQYRPIPRWSLNHELEPAELETQFRDFKRKGFGGVILHAGEGLKTRYLGDDWMKALRRIVDAANELKLEAWFADEDRGSSGYGGGTVTKDHDEFLPQTLVWADASHADDTDDIDTALAYTIPRGDGTIEQHSDRPENLDGTGVFYLVTAERGDARFDGEAFPDLLHAGAVQAFIDSTHAKYAESFKYDFGNHLPGILSTRATLLGADAEQPAATTRTVTLPWTAGLPAHFERMHGYTLTDRLHCLLEDSPEGFQVRHDYWRTVSDLFIDTFTFPLASWCSDHGMMYAGTVGIPGGLPTMVRAGGAVMPHYEHMAVPMVESSGKKPESITVVKEAVSAAAQFKKTRVMAQTFGGAGHDCSFADLKAAADIHTALGISVLSPQQTLYSTLGDRKYDTPPTFSYPHPAWDQMKALNDYLARTSWIAAQGRDTASVLVMSPFTAAYGACDLTAPDGGSALGDIEQSYRAVVEELTAEHISCHIGDERITGRYGEVTGETLRIGYGDYTTVILPPAQSWRAPVVELLESFTGQLIIMGEIPGMVDGRASDRIAGLTKRDNVTFIPDSPADTAAAIVKAHGRRLSVVGPDGTPARQVMAMHRIDAGAHLLFLANTDTASAVEVTVTVDALGGVVELDAATGRGFRYSARSENGATVIQTTLAASGSRIFIVDQTQTSVAPLDKPRTETPLDINGPFPYTLERENCLVLDSCALDMDKKSLLKHAPVWKVKRTIWEKTGLDEYRGMQPWVLDERNVRSRTNTTVLTFRFTVTDIPEKIALAMEQSDRFTVAINGTEIDFSPGRWFIDRRYRVLNLEDHVIEGENIITATTDYLWDTEISPLYIFGDFALGTAADGYSIMKQPEELAEGSWTDQGFPFYAGAISYTLSFAVNTGEDIHYELDLAGAKGTVCAVRVNESDIGLIPFPPYRGDVTGALVDGANTVEVTVYGSLRNMFGPLHNTVEEQLPRITANSFCDDGAWSDDYRVVPYGLLSPPRLIKITSGAPVETIPETGTEPPSRE